MYKNSIKPRKELFNKIKMINRFTNPIRHLPKLDKMISINNMARLNHKFIK